MNDADIPGRAALKRENVYKLMHVDMEREIEDKRRARYYQAQTVSLIAEREEAVRNMWRLVGFAAAFGFFAGWLFAGGGI